MAGLLLELFSEEIPARMQPRAEEDLKRLLAEALEKDGLAFKAIETYSTPRRLTAHVTGLPVKTRDISEERRGPKVGAPDQAVWGFSKSAGVGPKKLSQKDGYWYAKVEQKGMKTSEVLAKALPDLIGKFPWPKSMRWGAGGLRWVRPLHSILCILDGKVVPFEVDGVKSGNTTHGHRFMAPGEFSVKNFDDYKHQLNKHYVMLEPHDRIKAISAEIVKIEKKQGVETITDPALLCEVAGLVEWPVALLGKFDKSFLAVPEEALISEMKHHQKYFPVRDPKSKKLMNRFVFVANMVTGDKGRAITEGNERVLSARLFDAKFFWDQDRKIKLEDRLPALKGITFHEKLGSVAERVDRIEKLAGKIASFVPKCDPKKAKQAARLAKADLVTGMVGEFPELQGIMGGYYAEYDGEDKEVAQAIKDQYSPKGPSDNCPKAPVSVALALAENLEKLISFWSIDEKPTGSKDPFALRRAALSTIRLIVDNELRIQLQILHNKLGISDELMSFLIERLKVQQKEEGTRHDLIDAVFSLGNEDDLVRLLKKVKALQNLSETKDWEPLIEGRKRAVNIVYIEGNKDKRDYFKPVNPKLLKQREEVNLHQGLEAAKKNINQAIMDENFEKAMVFVANLRKLIDAFFDKVTVNVEGDEKTRENRLRLLADIGLTLLPVADFSKIQGG